MALALHPTQRVSNVNWGGAVFIYAEMLGNKLYYVQPSGQDEKPAIRTITLPEPPDLFSIIGSSYAKVVGAGDENKATFLVCGLRSVAHYIDDGLGNTVQVYDRHAIIYLSNNGIKWKEVRDQQATISDFDYQPSLNVMALVWNPKNKLFYYDQLFSWFRPHTEESSASDQIFKSSDGTSWTMISSTETSGLDYRSTFPSFCEHHDCKDTLGQNVPDGVMATDLQGKNTAKPTSPPTFYYGAGNIAYTPGESTVRIKRTSGDDVEEYTASLPGIGCVTCVAGQGNILMAGGLVAKDDQGSAGAVALSTDAGKTWKQIASTVTGVVTMIAAPPPAKSGN